MRPIDADALSKALFRCHVHDGNDEEPLVYLSDAQNLIATAPTVEAAPVAHGRWIECDEDGRRPKSHYKCSICGVVWGVSAMAMRYCPTCGAKMDGGEDDGADT